MSGPSRRCSGLSTAARFSSWLALAILLSALAPGLAQAQTEPVQFTISGTIEDAVPSPLDHAQLIVYRAGTSELLADRVFSTADGTYSTTFQADVVPNVDLDDPILPPAAYSGFWMGDAWPNPYQPGQDRNITLPFAAPSQIQARPDLEMFDTRGRRVRTGEIMASGIYFYRLRFEDRVTEARKLVLLGATRIQLDLQRVDGPDVVNPKFDGATRGSTPAARRAEGTIEVDVAVVKPGYVTQFINATLESRIDNQINASLDLEAIPTAQLSITGSLNQGEAVLFDGTGSSAPDDQGLVYSWGFGDGIRGGRQTVAHVYAEPGIYTVELTVSSTYGATASSTQEITIAAGAPPASTDATSMGTVRDAIGNLLEGVTVTHVGGTATGVSDAQGVVNLTGLPTGVPIALNCDKAGYTRQIIRMELPAGIVTSEFGATLRRQRSALVVAAIEDGTSLKGEDGVCIELPPDALQKPDGTPASGGAEVRLTPVDVSSELEAPAFPGSYEGVLADGSRGLIVSYGVAEFVIEQASEELQLKPGSTATVEVPVYTPGAAVDDQIALWSVDESTGLWTQEGTGVVVASAESPTGLALRSEVTHFSWWNCDMFLGDPYIVIPVGRIVDGGGLPIIDLPLDASTYIVGSMTSVSGPTSRPSINIPWDGGIPILLPPDLDIMLTASALNGTKRGSLLVNGASNVSDILVIPLDDPAGTPDELQLPVDTEATIDPVGDIDRYTFEATAGQFFNVFVEQATGSTLIGDLRVFAPDDTELHQSSFGGLSTSFAHQVIQTGTYTIEVDGTANEPGAYHMVVGFSEPYELTIPSFVDEDTQPGRSHVFLVSATEGEWFSVNYLRRENIGFGNIGFLRVEDPSGGVVYDLNFNSNVIDTGLIQATETGVYRVFLTSSSIEAAYTIFIRDVPELAVGGLVSGSTDERSTRYFRFTANQDDFLRSALDPVVNFTGSLSLMDGDGGFLTSQFIFGVQSGTQPTVIPATGDYFVRLVASFTAIRTLRDYRVSLNDILAPEVLTLDGAGRGQVIGGQIGLFGDVRFYQFSAAAASGVTVDLRAGEVSTLGILAKVDVYRIGGGSATNPDEKLQTGSIAVHNGNVSTGILEFGGYQLPSTDTYLVTVTAPAPEDGEFDLVVEVVAPSATLTVDDDLLDCPGADTRSVVAAALAAPTDAIIDICPGSYSYIVPIPMGQTGVQLVGSAVDEVTLRQEIRGTVIFVRAANTRIANLTVEPVDPANSTAVWLVTGDGAVVEDLVIQASVDTSDLKLGINLGIGKSDVTIRRVSINQSLRTIEGDADNVLIEDCLFEGGSGMLDVVGNEITVRNNTWLIDAIGQAIIIESGAGHQILDNQITVLTPDIGANLNTKAIRIEDDDATGTLPTTIISGNQITTNEAGFDLRLSRAGSAITCEQNAVQMNPGGHTAVVVIAQQDAGAEVVIQNNLFAGVSHFEGVHIRWADWYGSARFLNNTLTTDITGPVQATNPTIRVDLRSGTFTGALPVLLVNNVVQGPSAGVAVEVPLNTTIDSDYNLFNGYATYYNDGTTSTGLNDLLGQDPLFSGPFLSLDPASPAVDTGAGTGDVAEVPVVDWAGGPRPQGGGTDRGAHEQ
jgi:PKD repeat protein